MPDKKIEVEVRENGLYYPLGGQFWILMTKSWGLNDSQDYLKTDRLGGLRMVIEHTVDWCIPEHPSWNPIPFEKEKLLARLDSYTAKQLASSQETNQLILGTLTNLATEQPVVAEVCDRIKNLLSQSEGLVEQAKKLIKADAEEMFVIPTALQPRLSTAFFKCFVASFNVPFESLLPSSPALASTATATAPNS